MVENKTNKTPGDFTAGSIYKMAVAKDSHVKKPYYVMIYELGKDYIKTSIPGKHELEIKFGTYEWNYHIPRMTFIGEYDKSKHLLNNQKLL